MTYIEFLSEVETKTCSRCGGSGHYSFNLMHGTMCYGCKGSGLVYTKRGLKTKEFMDNSMKIPAEQVKVGDMVRPWICDREFSKVTETSVEVREDGSKVITIKMGSSTFRCCEGTGVRVPQTKKEKDEKILAALEYQNTLTITGKPIKKKVKK